MTAEKKSGNNSSGECDVLVVVPPVVVVVSVVEFYEMIGSLRLSYIHTYIPVAASDISDDMHT